MISWTYNINVRKAAKKVPPLMAIGHPLRGGIKTGPLRKKKRSEKKMTTKLEGWGGGLGP